MTHHGFPIKQGLYDPKFEHDACGVGFIAHIKNNATHDIVTQGVQMLCRMDHRGGQGSDPLSGDGAGIMTQIPHTFFQSKMKEQQVHLPNSGQYGVAMVFFPMNTSLRETCETIFEETIRNEGQTFLGWRDVPVDASVIGETARNAQPYVKQAFIEATGDLKQNQEAFERKLYVIRKKVEHAVAQENGLSESIFYVPSLSTRTIVYKGMLTPDQLDRFYVDLKDAGYTSAFSLVHSRFSTNTFPSWERAHPNRYLIHNGEINTLTGNVNWMKARQSVASSSLFENGIKEITPIIDETGSDSSMLDNALEFLTLGGRPLPKAAMMMIPEPWDKEIHMDPKKQAFYEYHSSLMEPWDGPTATAFSDGKQIGAMLDRNGLRPARYYVTNDDLVVFASEVGVLNIPEESIVEKKRLSPGHLLYIDLEEGRIVSDKEIKDHYFNEYPYEQWIDDNMIQSANLPSIEADAKVGANDLLRYQKAFGYTYEELQKNLKPMVTEKKDPIGSMGNDAPLAVLSNKSQLLYNYFKQLFAQVTNPPIDAIREECVTSTLSFLGAEGNLLDPQPESCRRIRLETPILTAKQLAALRQMQAPEFVAETLDMTFTANESSIEEGLHDLFAQADKAIANGVTLLILSDVNISIERSALPALLAVSGLHHQLVQKGTRSKVSLLVETAEARDVHHFSMLLGYGADAIQPYLGVASLHQLIQDGDIEGFTPEEAEAQYIDSATSGIVKVLSKMGISTIQSYRGAQIFEAIGIHHDVIESYFKGTASQLSGIQLDMIAKETLLRHEKAFHSSAYDELTLDTGGDLQYRRNEEHHAFNPLTIHTLQQASRTNNKDLYKKFSDMATNDEVTFLRGLLDFKDSDRSIPLEEVEPVESLFKRFKTGAMSYGALSEEAHEALAIAMNRIGGRSNSGEGGENPSRFTPDENGDNRISAIKQVASGRFGVNSHYLVNADEIQIKMAQGAKPGEGGQLPDFKVYPWIAEVRGTTAGVGLISPPPHHDIYSIEDLAQLIHDLKNANPRARISVKLVSKTGVGTIAAGVAKGLADVILIAGYEGGTGASPRTSIRHAGLPWEIGLAETHQTLLLNDLRDRIVLETDGKMMTGRDVVLATLLGAEEYGFSTAPLVVLGCILMRACHLDTCPVGVATQNPELRKKMIGSPDHVVNYMTFIAEEVREIMAQLGFRTIDEMIGRTDVLEMSAKAQNHWKAKDLDITALLYQPNVPDTVGRYHTKSQDHKLDQSLDSTSIVAACEPALERQEAVELTLPISNINRVVGTILGHEVTKRYGAKGLADHTIRVNLEGSAGQSLGAFLPKGITLSLTGDANDYVGKGLSGGKVIVKKPTSFHFESSEHVIAGNVAMFGATSGEAYINGKAGERFAVRNSGGRAVVEGVGDHGCEYMTGGRVVILGEVGKNFGAGMSGGVAYVLAPEAQAFANLCNHELIELHDVTDAVDAQELKHLIEQHALHTDSDIAKRLLADWENSLGLFVKVIPTDYREINNAITGYTNKGMSREEAIMKAFNAKKQKSIQPTSDEPLVPVEN
ncbi:glutamate synthase large subunit [Aureibacillus halotolerans]|uniref:Glutamate synthase (NADPH/NADH) large chain n=1 Tax=Aureibacillus halotolerans TaxID=1508390 RepID=A0A4R6U582_9BACI|nr:glutamate synthase large subunit [Aureibacillus halotolerans]TDQ39759.1 glutamate synthase (NADPH/NADH) large chain [Aureibacillus halotolerans]